MLSMDEEKYLTISDTSDLIDSGTDNFKTGQFNDIIIHEGRFVQIPGFKITSIFHILPYYPLCDARYAPGQSETDFSTISQSDYVLQQWRCNKWRSKYPSELVSYERTVWPITISTCPVYVGIHQKGLCFQHIWKVYLEGFNFRWLNIYLVYGRFLEMPQKTCEGCILHVRPYAR